MEECRENYQSNMLFLSSLWRLSALFFVSDFNFDVLGQ